MSDQDPYVAGITTETADPSAVAADRALTPGRLLAALAIALLLGWGYNTFVPKFFAVPVDLLNVQPTSPPEEQRKLAESEAQTRLGNGLVHFMSLGLALGLVPVLAGMGRSAGLTALVGVIAGLIGGAAAWFMGARVRDMVDASYPFPLLGDVSNNMGGDCLVWAISTFMLSLPLVAGLLLLAGKHGMQMASRVPLVAIFAGVLLPFLATFIFPLQRSDRFPLLHPGMLGLWLATTIVLWGLVLLAVQRVSKPKA